MRYSECYHFKKLHLAMSLITRVGIAIFLVNYKFLISHCLIRLIGKIKTK